MKKWTFAAVALAILVAAPVSASADTTAPPLLINGVASQEKNAHFIDEDGLMMVSEEVLTSEMDMVVAREKENVTVSTPRQTVLLQGKIGEVQATMNEQPILLSTPLVLHKDKVFLPLRSFVSHFGEIKWQGHEKPTEICYDFNQFEKVPPIAVSPTPLPYHEVVDGGVGFDNEKRQFLGDYPQGRLLFENLDEAKHAISISDASGKEVLVKPVHEGYQLINSMVENGQVTWIEVGPQEAKDKVIPWYLYTKSLTKQSKPVCVEKSPEKLKDPEKDPAHRLFHYVQMKGDHIAYPFYNQDNGKVELRLYTISKEKTAVLDSFSLAASMVTTEHASYEGGMEIALSDTDVVWNKTIPRGYLECYGDLYRYHFADQKKTALLEGCNFKNPLLIGDTMIVESMPTRQMVNPEAHHSGDLWLYDLKTNQWTGRLNNGSTKVVGQITRYRPLRDQYMTFYVEDTNDRRVPVVDVQKGIFYYAMNPQGEFLDNIPEGQDHDVPVEILASSQAKGLYKVSYIQDPSKDSVIQPLILGE